MNISSSVNTDRPGPRPAGLHHTGSGKTVSMEYCMLCPRRCGVNRTAGQTGFCRSLDRMRVARVSLHMWEEPCISGTAGSGTVFFTGCSLRCRFCQNAEISICEDAQKHSAQYAGAPAAARQSGDAQKHSAQYAGAPTAAGQSGAKKADSEDYGSVPMIWPGGKEFSPQEMSEVFLALQALGAANVNLVTAGHYVLPCAQALRIAKENGLTIPVVYNSSGYELPESLRLLDGLVDIYLPDFKFMDPESARLYCGAPDYPETAKAAVREMVRQILSRYGESAGFDEEGMMTHGVIVRQLLLPGHVREAKSIIDYLYHTWKDRIWLSMMSQYTPMEAMAKDPLLCRRVTKREYQRLVDYALSIGVTQAFIQERGAASQVYIPDFASSLT